MINANVIINFIIIAIVIIMNFELMNIMIL